MTPLKQATRRQNEQTSMSMTGRRRLSEGVLIFLSAVALYLLLALVTYHLSDPGWSSSGSGGFIANAGGRVGAWFSDLFLYFFGYIAYLFPFMLAFSAWGIFRGEFILHEFSYGHASLRFFGFILTLASACGLAGLYLIKFHAGVPLSAGGVFGEIVSSGLVEAFNAIGAGLVLVALFLVGITIFTGFSWLTFTSWVGKFCVSFFKTTLIFFSWIKEQFVDWKDARNDRKIVESAAIKVSEKLKIKEPKEKKEGIKKEQSIVVRETSAPKKVDMSKVKLSGELPSLLLLDEPAETTAQGYSKARLEDLSREIEACLKDYDVEAKVIEVHPGPVITRFELDLAPGTKASKVSALSKDLARALSMSSVRVVEVIPGKSFVGLEIPNAGREIVHLREILESKKYIESKSPVSLALGKNISGYPVVVDLAKMPHLLIAGTTGAGKSVSLNAMLLSILYKSTPEDLRLILIDPKMLELGVYDGIPHLLTPVVTDMREAANAFRWCVAEMDRRYTFMASLGVRNIDSYNEKVDAAIKAGTPLKNPFAPSDSDEYQTLEHLPYVVVAVDELSDMMMTVGKKVEELIARIAQKARAAGIHMILATQRPSVDVITGLIKANIPTRISFQVSSRIDSRTILDQMGAEQLLGYGDMLYLPPGTGLPVRVHGAYVSDDEISRVVEDWKQRRSSNYIEAVTQGEEEGGGLSGKEGENAESDPLYDQAVQIVAESRRASISYVQRRLKIGYNRSASMLEAMESAGVVSPMESNGSREVLVPPPQE